MAPTTERMRIDNNGNINMTNNLSVSGSIDPNGDLLKFPDTLNHYKISLWAQIVMILEFQEVL